MIRYSIFDKLRKAEVSLSIKPAVVLAGGWAEPLNLILSYVSFRRCSSLRISRRNSLPTLDFGSMSLNSIYWGTL